MMFNAKIVLLIGCLSIVKTTNPVSCDVKKSKTPHLTTQYPENAPRSEQRRSTENKNPLKMPRNDIKKPLRIKALPSVNTALTKENCCETFQPLDNIKFYHKEVNATAILNKIFYKFGRHHLKLSLNEIHINNISLKNEKTNLIKIVSNNFAEKNYLGQLILSVISKTFGNFRKVENGIGKPTGILNKGAFHLTQFKEPYASKRKIGKITFSDISGVFARRSSELESPDALPGNIMRVPELKLEEEYFPFGLFSRLMDYLQPSSFPIGFVKDALQNYADTHILILKIFKVEATTLGWIFLWFLLAFALPCAVIARFCCTANNMERLRNETSSITSEEMGDKWIRICLAFIMHLFLLLLLGCAILILISNEQISRSFTVFPNTTEIILKDVESFIENTQMQIAMTTSSSMKIAIDATHHNLEEAEELLGKPLQNALDAKMGLKTAIGNLLDLKEANAEISMRMFELLKDCNDARDIEINLQEKLEELSRLLTLARQECVPRDQALCDTLQTSGLNVSFRIDQVASDKDLLQLQSFEEMYNFNSTIEQAHRTFQGLPRRVSLETAISRAGLRSVLNKHRNDLYDAVRSLEDLSRSITGKLSSVRSGVLKEIQSVTTRDLWRWLTVLGLSLLIFFVWGLLMCGTPCGCDPTPKTIPFLLTGLGLTCALSLILWTLGTVAFILGGHGETLICQPLYDQPKYTVLGDLLNAGGILYHDEGLFNHLLKGNVSLRVDIVLRDCRNDQPTYSSFNLQNIFNVTLLMNFEEWDDFIILLEKFSMNLNNFEIIPPSLQDQLHQLSIISEVNLTGHRKDISGLVTHRDLNSLAEQLENVAKQLSVLHDAQRMETLAVKTREIISTNIKLLKDLRDKILYRMAAIEILIAPIRKKINQSLLHLAAIEHTMEHEVPLIFKDISEKYLMELQNYLLQMYKHTAQKITQDIGKCRPLWDSFNALRIIICKMTIDPLNGFSFACFLCILLFLGLAPVIIRTVAQYKETIEDAFSSITHRRARNGLIIDDEGTWVTPTPPSSSEGPKPTEATVWITPRLPEPELSTQKESISKPEPLVTSRPARLLDPTRLIQLPSRIQEPPRKIKSPIPRFMQPGTSKASRDRYESLKLIERAERRTPKSWL